MNKTNTEPHTNVSVGLQQAKEGQVAENPPDLSKDQKLVNQLQNDDPLTIRVGDIIVAYHKGYHRVIEIQRSSLTKDQVEMQKKYFGEHVNDRYAETVGNECQPIIVYQVILNVNGLKTPKQILSCEAKSCHKITEKEIAEHIDEIKNVADQAILNLQNLLK